MLTESFIVSTLNPEKPSNSVITGIHLYDFQPLPALKTTYKKSSTNANCLAISQSHVFAAQADKAVIHVYSRQRNNQEAVVPFPEKIQCLALAGESDGAGTLALGTEGGRVILWELGTGRQVSTPQNHLQPITCLVVDPTSNFLLSGSADSNINVWSIPALLSFSASSASDGGQDLPFAPLRSLSTHRAAITALVVGHSFSNKNIAVSGSTDKTCVVWDYFSGDELQIFLLPTSPLCLALDPADRAVFAGYEDGTIQLMDFYKEGNQLASLYDPAAQGAAIEPAQSARWSAEGLDSAVLCLQISYDGTSLISGHANGKIQTWDVARGQFGKQLADIAAPITNLQMLKPSGFPDTPKPALRLHTVMKPRYGSFANGDHYSAGAPIPPDYTFTGQFVTNIPFPGSDSDASFGETLSHPSFPVTFLDEALTDLLPSRNPRSTAAESSELAELRAHNTMLGSQLAAVVERQNIAIAEIDERDKKAWRQHKDEEIKAAKKKRRRLRQLNTSEIARKVEMRETIENADAEMDEVSGGEEDLSSSTDELLESD